MQRHVGASCWQRRTATPPAADEALGKLCETYWYPLYGYLRGRGHDVSDAEDLTQAFFAQLLEKKVLRHSDPSRGRFRSFLLTSLKNFTANERDRQLAKKRAPGGPLLPLDVVVAEERYLLEAATGETPERIFDRRWALALLDCVITRLASEHAAAGRRRQFERLKAYLTGEQPQVGYADTAAALGMNENAVKTAVHRLLRPVACGDPGSVTAGRSTSTFIRKRRSQVYCPAVRGGLAKPAVGAREWTRRHKGTCRACPL